MSHGESSVVHRVRSQGLSTPRQSPREAGIGMPWTWQSSSIDAVDAEQHKDGDGINGTVMYNEHT